MLLTKSIASAIIEKNKTFAPNAARVMLVHEDSRVIFAEKFEQGATFWYADNLRLSKLQGIIHKLTLVAKRNDQGIWVGVSDFSTKIKPQSRQERMVDSQEKLRAARANVIPATKAVIKSDPHKEPLVPKPSKVVEVVKPVVAIAEKFKEDESEFISIRELEPVTRHRIASELFVSFRPDGKIVLCKALRDTIVWTTLNLMVSKDFKRFAVMPGKDYNVNQSGTYVNRALCAKLKFPENTGTIRAVVKWDDNTNMYVGEFQ